MNNVTRKTLLKSQQTRFDWPGEYNVPTTVVNTTYAMPNHRALGCLQKIELINSRLHFLLVKLDSIVTVRNHIGTR